MKRLNLMLSILAGVAGGFAQQYVFQSIPVYAQADHAASKTIEAGIFRLVNPAGHVAASIMINANGDGVITMFDATGKTIFTSEEKR